MSAAYGNIHPASWRDPSGFVFTHEGILYRQVNCVFSADFEQAESSGFFEAMIKQGLLIPHERIDQNLTGTAEWYCTLKPAVVPFISWPYEWSFSMLKDAALLTLSLAHKALEYGLVLKDATPYNVQFTGCKPVFIDTLSFAVYTEKEPWIAYRQFCECFLAPLLLSRYTRQSMSHLLLSWPEGIPLKTTKALLPWKSRFSLHTWLHIHLHAGLAGKKGSVATTTNSHFTKQKMISLLESLRTLVQGLELKQQPTTWSDYYEEAATREGYLAAKKEHIRTWISELEQVKTAADLGSNDGEFSRLLREAGKEVVATDFDSACVNQLYEKGKAANDTGLLPLVLDLANPTAAIGVNNTERSAFTARIHTDMAMALALIHHLSIGKNIPFSHVAAFFQSIAAYLIIEFVPKTDPKVVLMLQQKKDIYDHYSINEFENAFGEYYTIQKKTAEGLNGRTLYLMRQKPKNR